MKRTRKVKKSCGGLLASTLYPLPSTLRRGQILIPSLLVIPSLLIFVYLLFETTKLSREKIRQQFATDSAAFIQMGDYTNLLNRTAYVNGAFPYRIFKEAYECPPEGPFKKTDSTPDICPYDLYYANGAFPKYKNDVQGAQPSSLDGVKKWEIEFDPAVRPEFLTNPTSQQVKPVFDLIQQNNSPGGWRVYMDWGTAVGYYKFYAQVYSLLGSVQESQWTVFDRLTESFNFFRKSYYLNANTPDCVNNPQTCGNDGIYSNGGFNSTKLTKGSSFLMHYIQKVGFTAKVFIGGDLSKLYQQSYTAPPMDMTIMAPDGLFQLATVDKDRLRQYGEGLHVFQGWDTPSNYFNVDFNNIGKCNETGRPCVHALITSQCPGLKNKNGFTEDNNCVWPSPTPKYQTRLYP